MRVCEFVSFLLDFVAVLMYLVVFELGGPLVSVGNNLDWSYCLKPQMTATVRAVSTPVLEQFAFLFVC